MVFLTRITQIFANSIREIHGEKLILERKFWRDLLAEIASPVRYRPCPRSSE
jgi:hypothetical protein